MLLNQLGDCIIKGKLGFLYSRLSFAGTLILLLGYATIARAELDCTRLFASKPTPEERIAYYYGRDPQRWEEEVELRQECLTVQRQTGLDYDWIDFIFRGNNTQEGLSDFNPASAQKFFETVSLMGRRAGPQGVRSLLEFHLTHPDFVVNDLDFPRAAAQVIAKIATREIDNPYYVFESIRILARFNPQGAQAVVPLYVACARKFRGSHQFEWILKEAQNQGVMDEFVKQTFAEPIFSDYEKYVLTQHVGRGMPQKMRNVWVKALQAHMKNRGKAPRPELIDEAKQLVGQDPAAAKSPLSVIDLDLDHASYESAVKKAMSDAPLNSVPVDFNRLRAVYNIQSNSQPWPLFGDVVDVPAILEIQRLRSLAYLQKLADSSIPDALRASMRKGFLVHLFSLEELLEIKREEGIVIMWRKNVTPDGYLVAFPKDFLLQKRPGWLEQIQFYRPENKKTLTEPFVFIQQIAVNEGAPSRAGVALTREIYENIALAGGGTVVGEIALDPFNPASYAYHIHVGMQLVGEYRDETGMRWGIFVQQIPAHIP